MSSATVDLASLHQEAQSIKPPRMTMTVIDAEFINHESQSLSRRLIVLPRRARGARGNDTGNALAALGSVDKFEHYGDLVVVKLGEGWSAEPCGWGVDLYSNGKCVCTVPFGCSSIRFSS